jgi:hypothetical protein
VVCFIVFGLVGGVVFAMVCEGLKLALESKEKKDKPCRTRRPN